MQTEAWRDIFSTLEQQQSEFLSKANELRSKEYRWPTDPLHCWSRIWEYPYIYYHLSRYVNNLADGHKPRVVDVGSGVTFFPFALAQRGYEVICTDIDSVCGKDLARAGKCFTQLPGTVHFRLIDSKGLPFDDEECDVVYCISVLEHIPDFESSLREMVRILKPGGLCLITCDLVLDPLGNTQLNIDQYERLTSLIGEEFRFIFPERTVHPVDVLTSRSSPYSVGRSSFTHIGWELMKQKILKPLLGRKPGNVNVLGPAPLAVLGLALQKK